MLLNSSVDRKGEDIQKLSDNAPLFKSEGVSANPECAVPVLLPRRMRAAERVTILSLVGGRVV